MIVRAKQRVTWGTTERAAKKKRTEGTPEIGFLAEMGAVPGSASRPLLGFAGLKRSADDKGVTSRDSPDSVRGLARQGARRATWRQRDRNPRGEVGSPGADAARRSRASRRAEVNRLCS